MFPVSISGLIWAIIVVTCEGAPAGPPPQLVVILLDGFRWDYYDIYKEHLPTFTRFLAEGVRAQWVNSDFPSMSFPNWVTLATGVYPEVHNFIGNVMYDRSEVDPKRRIFNYHDLPTTRDPKWWQTIEPIWITAVKNGKKSYVKYWPNSDVPYHGDLPTEFVPYGGEHGEAEVKDTFRDIVQKLRDGFDLVMVHVNIIDDIGHHHGPTSKEMIAGLKLIDNLLRDLLDQLHVYDLEGNVNVIMVGDHGMTYIGEGSGIKHVVLPDHIALSEADVFVDLKWARMWFCVAPKERLLHLYNKLKTIEGLDVYLRSELPERWHIKHSKYAQDILVTAKEGYIICGYKNTDLQIPRWNVSCWLDSVGIHGYAPEMPDMRAIFYARGPNFKKGFVNPPIDMVDVYQLYTHLLKLPPHPHNGTWSKIAEMLVNK